MADVLVRGAGGRAARAAIARLEALGHTVLRHGGREAGPLPAVGDLLLDLAPAGEGGRADRRARWASALDAGRHVLAASLDPADLLWARETWDAAAAARGLSLLPTAGQGATLGDALATLAGPAAGGDQGPDEVHTAHLVLERGGLLRAASPGLRAEVAALAGSRVVVRDGGQWVQEAVAERRRLAWFARPVGPHHAATVPAPEVHTIPRHQPSARLVAGHLAMATWQAELLQAVGGLAGGDGVGLRLRRWVARPGRRAPVEDARWAVVAEASGPRGVARAWANGRDPSGTTGEVVARLADAVLAGGTRGVPAPSELLAPDELLDGLADDGVLRWAVIRPQ